MIFEGLTLEAWNWINERSPIVGMDDSKGIVARSESDGKIMGVCVMDTWSANSVQLHIAADNPMCWKRGGLQYEVFNYVFNTCGRGVAIGVVPGDNVKALNFDKKLGFTEVFRVKDGWASGVDSVILELRKENCCWIEQKREAA